MTRILFALACALLASSAIAAPDQFNVEISFEGTGNRPGVQDTVVAHYVGRFKDGTVFDSSVARNEPATLQLSHTISCWVRAFPLLAAGSKATLTCPADTAYGEQGVPGAVPPNATLYFDVELFEVIPFVAPK